MKPWRVALIFALGLATPAGAGEISALIGPPSLGQGGSNPLSIPPSNLLDWQLSHVNEGGREWTISIVPGLYYGQRWQLDQLHIGLGGGVLVSPNGLGLGVYQSLGVESEPFWRSCRLEIEYRQLLGFTAIGAEFPYTLRIGLSYGL